MGRRRNRPKIKIYRHYMQIDGELVEIDPAKAGIPDRCKQAGSMCSLKVKPALNDRCIRLKETNGPISSQQPKTPLNELGDSLTC